MIITGGKIATQKGLEAADLLIDGEKGTIAGIMKSKSSAKSAKGSGNSDEGEEGKGIFDATGLVIFPGGIDPHVHLRDPQSPQKEDFYTGTCAALAGGYTTVFDMPNYFGPATTTKSAYKQKLEIAKSKAVCNWALHFGATMTNHDEVAAANPPSIKAYLGETDSELTFERLDGLLEHFEKFPKEKPICIHAEDLDALRYFAKRFPKERFSVQRPSVVSQAASARVAALSSYFGRRIHLCHASTVQEVLSIKQNAGATVEATPHHLFLDAQYEKKLEGNLHHVKPALRPANDVYLLWKNLQQIDCMASDHAPHTLEEKRDGASGFPGLETTLPLMLWAYRRKIVTIPTILRLCMEGPAKAFNLKGRGSIKEGFAADLALFDLNESWKVKAEDLFTKCAWSPYEGMAIGPRPRAVFLAGKLAYERGKRSLGAGPEDTRGQVLAKKGNGKPVA